MDSRRQVLFPICGRYGELRIDAAVSLMPRIVVVVGTRAMKSSRLFHT